MNANTPVGDVGTAAPGALADAAIHFAVAQFYYHEAELLDEDETAPIKGHSDVFAAEFLEDKPGKQPSSVVEAEAIIAGAVS